MPTIMERLRDLDARAVRLSTGLVRESTVADLRRPTPCEGWDLADLLGHMTAQHRGFAAAARGAGGEAAVWAVAQDADPVAAYEAAAADVVTAFAAVDDPEQPFTLPEFSTGPDFPARLAVGFHFLDYVVHAWDVAVTLGVPFTPDADLVEAALPIALAVPPASPVFADPLPAAPDADPLTRVLTWLGRSPRG
ncbi:TIGR03086 family metal-binding protein [Streptomyces sp. NPDC021224]|uniref:TIGR03086 family metal-binding protein n=1 Tax=unclassified Streptomyces TaxID=2593676 RepID=UPI003795326E